MLEDDGAFLEELFIRYRATMLRRAEQIVRNVHDAQDVVSDVWISLMRHLPELLVMDERARSTYIMKSVCNMSIDHLRRSKRQSAMQLQLEEGLTRAPAELSPLRELSLCGIYAALLSALTERERQVVKLRLQGLRNAEIAQTLGIRPPAVSVHLYRARKHMQRKLDALSSDDGDDAP